MPDARIRDTVRAQQQRLLADLQAARAKFNQGTDRGTAGLEVPFREFLRNHLPRRLAVGEGEVIDSQGRTSAQTDVLILDDDHPFRVEPDEPCLALIEGVAAAGELKTVLTGGDLATSLSNSARFKELRAEEPDSTIVRSNASDLPRFYDHRPYFILAAESQLTIETVAERARQIDLETDGQIADAIYLLDRGWVVNFGDGAGSFQFLMPGGASAQAWVAKEIPSGEVLFDFFVWLSAVMPRLHRFVSPYLKYL
jgi:hypothetical protein